MTVQAADTSDIKATTKKAAPPKPYRSYLLNKCLIGYGLVNGVINAIIFSLMHQGDPEALFGYEAILFDMALTGVLLGVILFACVVPLTKMDLRKRHYVHDGGFSRILSIVPASYGGAILVVGVLAGVFVVALAAVAALVLPLPLTVTQMMIFKGCGCAMCGAFSGYLTISYATRAVERA